MPRAEYMVATTFSMRGCSLWFQPVSIDFVAILVARAQHQAALHARPCEHRRKRILVMIAPGHVIERARSPAELAHEHHQRFVEQHLAGSGLRRRDREILDQARERRVEVGHQLVVIVVLGAVPDVAMVIPSVLADVDVVGSAILAQYIAGQRARQPRTGISVPLAIFVADLECRGPARIGQQRLRGIAEIFECLDVRGRIPSCGRG